MATCGSCGKEIRDDDWTCGHCGAPVSGARGAAGSGASSSGYAPSYEPEPAAYGASEAYGAPAVYGAPTQPPTATGGLSRSTLTIILVAAVAVVAIIAVWFFVLRDSGGASPFLGTWNEPSGGTASVVIKKHGGDFELTMSGKDSAGAQKTYTIPAHLAGSSLEITVDDFVKATGNEEQATQAKAVFESMIKDFRLVFTLQDPTHLEMKVEGTPVGGSAPSANSSIVLVKGG